MSKPEPTSVENIVGSADLIVSKSDAEGNITYVNPIFIKISGYSQGKLIEEPHSMLRHPDMPKVIFKYLWDNLKEGRDVVAYVKNLCKNGSFYWVLATVRVAKNPDGSFRNYLSTRKCITDSAKKTISSLYADLLAIQQSDGVESSENMLNTFLAEKGVTDCDSFNNLMIEINK
ncbi:PAS domain-containing protein [Sulfurimonas sp.]|uniref:PAS domain-containing protein n=1 Tax=Sulfurimonas sp. TaxID=2022749 RepID=UPI002B45F4E7|nr:PAS domain-containing protein [Sulfurimonas sp.]